MLKSAIAVWHRLRSIVLRRRLDRDLDDEIAFHLDMRAAEYRSGGATPDEAQLAARRAFGNVTSLKEHTRDMELQHHLRFQALERHEAGRDQPCRQVGDGGA